METELIMEWIDKYWKNGHIMSRDKNLFEYEFMDEDHLNIVLVIDKVKKSIEGLQGIIKYSFGSENFDIAGSFLKVLPKDNMPMLGVELVKRVLPLSKCRYFCSIGSNPKTAMPIYSSILKCNTVKLSHYYLLNDKIRRYNVAIVNEKNYSSHSKLVIRTERIKYKFCKTRQEIETEINFENTHLYPYKDSRYIEKRFINYPYYKYLLLVVEYNNDKCLIVYRVVNVNNSRVIRFVDFYGEQSVIAYCNFLFCKLLYDNNAEYIDIYCSGFSDIDLLKAGFRLKDDLDKNVIPNYFEPFVQENVDIYGVYNSPNALFFKADGDQDRPSLMKTNT